MVHARHTHLICGFMFTLFILEKCMQISHKVTQRRAVCSYDGYYNEAPVLYY